MYNDLVTISDVNCAFRCSKNNTSVPDGVQYGHMKQLSDAGIRLWDFNVSTVLRFIRYQKTSYTTI